MPGVLTADEDDPVIATYDVYISESPAADTPIDSKLFILQYPSHRPAAKPYNVQRLQKPAAFRLKSRTGMLELDVPILTQEHYNPQAGAKYGQALAESRISQSGATHGLAGGFASAPSHPSSLRDLPEYGQDRGGFLATQTLGGKVASSSERDPIYMLGSFHRNALHLTHLDAVVQMRPQLHHIDAEEEAHQKKLAADRQVVRSKPGLEPPLKLETKAIELKIKDSKEDPKNRNLNANARQLRDIQADTWSRHEWVDEDDAAAWEKHRLRLLFHSHASDRPKAEQLEAMVSNDDWLDKMSAPREDGKKGLRSKLKGRDRERARRKKVEKARRQAVPGPSALAPSSEESEVGSPSEDEGETTFREEPDTVMIDASAGLGEDDVKQDPESLAAAPAAVPAIPDPVPVDVPTPRRRGRPKKNI